MTKIQLDNDSKAFKYLKLLRPEGFINVVAIDPVSGNVSGITRKSNSPEILAFIKKNNGTKNLYYMVNEPFEDAPDNKLSKKHVKNVYGLYIDADPIKDKSFSEERERLAIFAKQLNDSESFPATFVIDSGGGYQALWMLEKPIKPDEIVEQYGRGLAYKYNTDAVQNLDRIMRLPYTWNIPTKGKIGREKSLAKIVYGSRFHYDWERLKRICKPEAAPEYESLDTVNFDHSILKPDLRWQDVPKIEERFYKLMHSDHTLRSLMFKDIVKPSRSEYDFSLAKHLKMAGWTLEDTAIAMWLFPHGKGKELTTRDIIRAYSRAENPFAEMAITTEVVNLQVEGEVIQQEKVTKRLRLTHANEIETRSAGKPLLKGLFDQQSMIVTYGQSNVGKSFVALDQAMHIAIGKDWGEFKCKQKFAVIYIFAEAGNSAGRRIKAARKRLNIPDNATEKEFPFYPITTDVNLREKPTKERDDVNDIILLCAEVERRSGFKVGLVVIDTLSTTFAGGNENSSEDVGAFITNCKLIQHNADVTTEVVHHAGKDQAAGARGHSSLRAATDTELEVKSEKIADKWCREIVVKKQRDKEVGGRIKFGLNVISVGKDEDGDDITSCQVILESDSDFEAVIPSITADLSEELKLVYYAVYLAQMTGNGHQNLVNAWAEYLFVNETELRSEVINKLIEDRPVSTGIKKSELSKLNSRSLNRWITTLEEKRIIKSKVISRETGNILWEINE
jgi:archaellum biogenesis ATPase FlaH